VCSYYTVWVSRWVDYSKKYGLGYKLSNGCSGVFFNDATKMLLQVLIFLLYQRKITNTDAAKMLLQTDGDSLDYIERIRCL
jgi:hypothetical protein